MIFKNNKYKSLIIAVLITIIVGIFAFKLIDNIGMLIDIIRKFINSDLARKGFEINDGICIRDQDSSARICADDERQAFHVYVESMSEEYGKDIAGEILRTLENLLT